MATSQGAEGGGMEGKAEIGGMRRVCHGTRALLGVVAIMMTLAITARGALALNHFMAIDEVLASWQGDDLAQFVELRTLAPGQNKLAGARLQIFDSSNQLVQEVVFQGDVAAELADGRILIATSALMGLVSFNPDFLIDAVIPLDGGRICYLGTNIEVPGGLQISDCLAYGSFMGDNGLFGSPAEEVPVNRSLRRNRLPTGDGSDDNSKDFDAELNPTPQNSVGQSTTLPTSCNGEVLDSWEGCDGNNLPEDGTCVDQGFVSGEVTCTSLCDLDLSDCNNCGNNELDDGEECDGTFIDSTCSQLGFTSGTLACTDDCLFDTSACEAPQIPGGGSGKKNCFLEWGVINPDQRLKNGRPKVNQRCVDGDPTCDFDGGAVGSCTFNVRLCVNRDDVRLPKCEPRGVSSFRVRRPSPGSEDPIDQANANGLLGAVATLGGTVAGDSVTFTPALETIDQCTEQIGTVVPLRERPGKRAKKGKRIFKTIVTDRNGRRKDKDKLKLICLPGS